MSRKLYVFNYNPTPPYMISRHFEQFTLPGEPSPTIYDYSTRSIRRLIALGEGFVPVRVFFEGEPWNPRISIEVYARGINIARKAYDKILSMLRVDFNYNEFLEQLGSDENIYNLALKYVGLRPSRSLSLYGALIDSVVKQRISLKAALRITSRFIHRYGLVEEVDGLEYYDYPKPSRLVEAGIDELRAIGLTRIKARALREIALAEIEGRLPDTSRVLRDPLEALEELVEIPGIGRWTAELALAMVSKDFKIGPAGDLAVRRGLSKIYKRELSEREVRRILRRHEEFMGLIMYLASLG